MAEIWTMGELLCEIMRPDVGTPLYQEGIFRGPFPSGAPAIFIDTVARLEHSAGIIGGVGRDDFGKNILDRLRKDGVDTSLVIESDKGSTGVAFVTYFEDGSRRFLYHFTNTPAAEPKMPDIDKMGDVRYFHIMGCSLMASEEFGREIIKTMHALADKGVKISFDPNIRPELMRNETCVSFVREVMESCNVFFPGVSELLMITGKEELEEAVTDCFTNPNLNIVVLKNGSKGCSVYTREERFSLGVYPTEVLDATGAGDCFDGAFLCGLLEGRSLIDTAKIASAAASLNTAAFGPMEGRISREAVFKKVENESIEVTLF